MNMSITPGVLVRRCVIGTVLLVACNRQPASPIQGRWKAVDSDRTIEFKRNGDVQMSDEGTGKYRLLDKDHVELRGAALRTTFHFEVNADHLRLEPEGETALAPEEYQRIK